jgi:hypothetical protein
LAAAATQRSGALASLPTLRARSLTPLTAAAAAAAAAASGPIATATGHLCSRNSQSGTVSNASVNGVAGTNTVGRGFRGGVLTPLTAHQQPAHSTGLISRLDLEEAALVDTSLSVPGSPRQLCGGSAGTAAGLSGDGDEQSVPPTAATGAPAIARNASTSTDTTVSVATAATNTSPARVVQAAATRSRRRLRQRSGAGGSGVSPSLDVHGAAAGRSRPTSSAASASGHFLGGGATAGPGGSGSGGGVGALGAVLGAAVAPARWVAGLLFRRGQGRHN